MGQNLEVKVRISNMHSIPSSGRHALSEDHRRGGIADPAREERRRVVTGGLRQTHGRRGAARLVLRVLRGGK